MRRRALLQHSVLAAGAVMASPVLAALGRVENSGSGSALLARLDGSGLKPHWQPWSECSAGCLPVGMQRIRLDRIAFPEALQRAAVDAVFATFDGPRPFRIASLHRDSLSPISKPFAFGAQADALLGFRVEQHLHSEDRSTVMAFALLDAKHKQLLPGRYLLAMAHDCDNAELSRIVRSLPAAEPAKQLLAIANIEFTVLHPGVG